MIYDLRFDYWIFRVDYWILVGGQRTEMESPPFRGDLGGGEIRNP